MLRPDPKKPKPIRPETSLARTKVFAKPNFKEVILHFQG